MRSKFATLPETRFCKCPISAKLQLTWKTFINGDSRDIASYKNGNQRGIGIAGVGFVGTNLPITSNCGLPTTGTFSTCDATSQNYTETNNNTSGGSVPRMYMMLFDAEDNIQWSTFYGSDNHNEFHGITFNQNKIFTVGSGTNYTFEEYDIDSQLDYYDDILNDNGLGYTDASIAMFEITDMFVGINEYQDGSATNFQISPNPFADRISITSFQQLEFSTTIQIHNSIGQLVINTYFSKGKLTKEIDTSKLKSGVYYIQVIKNNTSIYSTKLIKQY